MAFVDLDSIYHFQPPRSIGRPLKGRSEGRSAAWKLGASTVSSEHCSSVASVLKTKTSADLENREPVSCIDLTTPLLMETGGDLFDEPALSVKGMETVQGKALFLRCRWSFNNDFQILSRLRPISRRARRRTTRPSCPSRSCYAILEKHRSDSVR